MPADETETQMKNSINQKLIEAGEKDRLKTLLKERLAESDWHDQLKDQCRQVIREKGAENITVDDLVTDITPRGRALVPDSVKKELLQKIKAFLAEQANL